MPKFSYYADALRKNDAQGRDTVLKWAREDPEISIREYIDLEKLDVAITEQENEG